MLEKQRDLAGMGGAWVRRAVKMTKITHVCEIVQNLEVFYDDIFIFIFF